MGDAEKMSAPPYADLGKKARDIFGAGYHFGLVKLDVKTKSEGGVEFNSNLTSNNESGKVAGSLTSKYKVKDYGLVFTEKWNTDNVLLTDIALQDTIQGLRMSLETTFAPQTGNKTGKLRTSYANEKVALNCDFDIDRAGPIADLSAVLKYENWLLGYKTQFDSQKNTITTNRIAFGFSTKDFALHTNIDDGKNFGGNIFQKVNDKLECGISLNWQSGNSETTFGIGGKYALDENTFLRAKVNNASQIGLGFQQKLRDGVHLTLSTNIDAQNFDSGSHKLGLALELEP